MTDCTTSHAGIELDLIDLPGRSKDKIDSRAFVKYIFQKMLEDESFLSFFVQVRDVNKILKTKYSSADDIAMVILKDASLTSKLLKLVNSSFYGQFSNKGIANISEAMVILGTAEIELAALSLKIYELMLGTANIKILKDKALRALQRSIIARAIIIGSDIKNAEAIQVSAMLYDFGEYLLALFSPKIFLNIEIYADENGLSSEQASKFIIGISYNELGRLVASKWKLPSSIISAMKPITEFNINKARLTFHEFQRNICAFSNELCNIEFSMDRKYIDLKISDISKKYKKALGITASEASGLLNMSWNKIIKHASILKMNIKK